MESSKAEMQEAPEHDRIGGKEAKTLGTAR